MKSEEKKTAVHYQVLVDLAGEYKMDALEALQLGQDKFKELEKTAPLLFRYIRAFRPIFEGKKVVPKWVYDLYETHQSVKKYLDSFIKIPKGYPLLGIHPSATHTSLDAMDAQPEPTLRFGQIFHNLAS